MTAEARGEAPDQRSLGMLDAIASIVAVLGLASVWALQLFAVPSFVAMFADFGSGALPALTQLVMRPIASSALSLVVLGTAGAGIGLRLAGRGRARREGRAVLGGFALGMAAVLPWLALPVMLYALYEPIFALSGAIRP